MRKNKYQEIDEKEFSNPAFVNRIIERIAEFEAAFNAGDRSALFSVLQICAQYQAVIPPWAADEILQGATDLESGKFKDVNAFFGWNSPSLRERRKEARIREFSSTVLARLAQYRCDGGSLNAEEAYGTVAEETGLPRRIVEEIHKRHGSPVKSIPQGNPQDGSYGFMIAAVPMQRRYGRKIL